MPRIKRVTSFVGLGWLVMLVASAGCVGSTDGIVGSTGWTAGPGGGGSGGGTQSSSGSGGAGTLPSPDPFTEALAPEPTKLCK